MRVQVGMGVCRQFTWRQMIIRLVFATISLAAFTTYATKIICRLREMNKKYLTLEQKGLLGLVFLIPRACDQINSLSLDKIRCPMDPYRIIPDNSDFIEQ